ncbi:MAG: dihydroneopterin aldolase [Proteobacteria bacterium]|nr:dihydroneopterin aldolase [Pseudomonadota bacterium]
MKMSVKAAVAPAGTADHPRRTRQVFVRRLEVMASVGVFEVEKRYEQRIIVSVDLDVADDYDGVSDRLDDVLDYGEIVNAVRRIVGQGHVHLIETLAERIADACLGDTRVRAVRVAIEKPDIVAGCEAVGIAIERRAG